MTKDDAANACLFMAGAALGAAIAMLYTPVSGVETRRRIATGAQATRELYQQGVHLAEEAAEMMQEGRRLVKG